jgi:Mrp family chromosome partitioning ATPase
MTGQATLEKVCFEGPHENLTILPMGKLSDVTRANLTPERFQEILSNVRRQYYTIHWEDTMEDFLQTGKQEMGLFDYIWVDSPPIIPTSEIHFISEAVDAILLVVRAGVVPKQTITRAMKILNSSKVVGAVLNRTRSQWPSQYSRYMYYGS